MLPVCGDIPPPEVVNDPPGVQKLTIVKEVPAHPLFDGITLVVMYADTELMTKVCVTELSVVVPLIA
jgi:hypothetical protein